MMRLDVHKQMEENIYMHIHIHVHKKQIYCMEKLTAHVYYAMMSTDRGGITLTASIHIHVRIY
jgi:hypothetical protein